MIAFADVGVSVTNAKVSAQWWVDKLGFETFTLGGEGGHAVLVAPPGERYLLHLCEGFERVDPGNTGIAFMTDDIDSLFARMVAGGVAFPEPLVKKDWGGSAKFADPDGNLFWLVEAPAKMIRETTAMRAGRASRKSPRKTARKAPPSRKAAKKAKAPARRTSSSRGRKASRSRR